mgnify:CR=1 FL=1
MKTMRITRRAALALTLAALPGAALARGDFSGFVETLWPRARAAGVSRETFESVAQNLEADASLIGLRAKQAEFSKPLSAYLAEAASAGRASRAQAQSRNHGSALSQIESRSGVDKEIVLAIWGMETDFGRDMGNRDVLRSLATLAYAHPDNPVYGDEFIAGLVMLEKGLADRAQMKGSWAGAMGNPQFMPSAYLKHALSLSGGAPDIWTSVPDSLASIANFMKNSGWVAGSPPLVETRIPDGFDWSTLKQSFGAWSRMGFRDIDGDALPASGEAMLFLPAGARGPALLLGPNFFVLKAYNFSDSYAAAVAVLANRIGGGAGVRASWPKDDGLDASGRSRIQTILKQKGFYDGKIDGRFGPITRLAVHAYQKSAGVSPADGFPSKALLARMSN